MEEEAYKPYTSVVFNSNKRFYEQTPEWHYRNGVTLLKTGIPARWYKDDISGRRNLGEAIHDLSTALWHGCSELGIEPYLWQDHERAVKILDVITKGSPELHLDADTLAFTKEVIRDKVRSRSKGWKFNKFEIAYQNRRKGLDIFEEKKHYMQSDDDDHESTKEKIRAYRRKSHDEFLDRAIPVFIEFIKCYGCVPKADNLKKITGGQPSNHKTMIADLLASCQEDITDAFIEHNKLHGCNSSIDSQCNKKLHGWKSTSMGANISSIPANFQSMGAKFPAIDSMGANFSSIPANSENTDFVNGCKFLEEEKHGCKFSNDADSKNLQGCFNPVIELYLYSLLVNRPLRIRNNSISPKSTPVNFSEHQTTLEEKKSIQDETEIEETKELSLPYQSPGRKDIEDVSLAEVTTEETAIDQSEIKSSFNTPDKTPKEWDEFIDRLRSEKGLEPIDRTDPMDCMSKKEQDRYWIEHVAEMRAKKGLPAIDSDNELEPMTPEELEAYEPKKRQVDEYLAKKQVAQETKQTEPSIYYGNDRTIEQYPGMEPLKWSFKKPNMTEDDDC